MNLLRIFIICFIIPFSVFSQDKVFLSAEDYKHLLIGRVFQESIDKKIVGSPYFPENNFYKTNLLYKDIYYKDLSTKFDIFSHRLILYQEFSSNLPRFLILNNNFIQSFEFYDEYNSYYKFISLKEITGLPEKIGFYQVIYDGNIKYIIGRTKKIKQLAVDGKFDKYEQSEVHYIVKENKAYKIRNKKDILNISESSKNQLKQFIKEKKLRVKLSNPGDIAILIQYFESIV